jgi:hypothetical protein
VSYTLNPGQASTGVFAFEALCRGLEVTLEATS